MPLTFLACDGCGRAFGTEDADGMLTAIKGCCQECGGQFKPPEAGHPEQHQRLVAPLLGLAAALLLRRKPG